MAGLALATAVVASTAQVVSTTAATADPAAGRPFIQAGQTVPVYSYANATRESVWVQSPVDSDGDGQPDRIAVDVIRPSEAAAAGVDVPVIMIASPYYQSIGRGLENESKRYDDSGVISKFPLFYDNYYVPRGYAVVQVDLAGTNRSTGCNDISGEAEVLGAKAAIDWLNGRASAAHADGRAAVADWTTGKVGMIGKSWDGTVANGVAATGVEGLATIVPIGAISSWYDYMRLNGILRGPDGVPWHHNYVSARPDGVCDAMVAAMQAAAGEDTGDYTDFWAQRDFTSKAGNVRASVFAVHGLNDLNVMTSQFGNWWSALAAHDVPRKVWLSQTGHVEPFDFRRSEWVNTLHQWFDYWLQGIDNGVMAQPMASVERSPNVWTEDRSWPPASVRTATLPLGWGDGVTGTIGGPNPVQRNQSYVDAPGLTEANAVSDPSTAKGGRLVFLNGPLGSDLRISGTPTVTLRVQVDKPTTSLTARLVDYGTATRVDHASGGGIRLLPTESCYGESTALDDGCYRDTALNVATRDHNVLTRGWLDAAHHVSLRQTTPLQPGVWYTVTLPLQTADAVIPADHVLGLILTQTDAEYTYPRSTGATVRVALKSSALNLPLATTTAPAMTDPAPRVSTTDKLPKPGRDSADKGRLVG
ncbi:Xaa-Pro dipeptidyl-peptidase [Plantactinospora sp. GCM10030261]|uniref:Xaa-Pro dipeptidyl-peptidase n=1 Tax=Plantactinospora sp. GCM10030261 TaxID=3273420 RepID=UPI003617F440